MDKGKFLAFSVVLNVVLLILLLVARAGSGRVEGGVYDERTLELLSFEREVVWVLESGERGPIETLKEKAAASAAVHEEYLRGKGVDVGPAPQLQPD